VNTRNQKEKVYEKGIHTRRSDGYPHDGFRAGNSHSSKSNRAREAVDERNGFNADQRPEERRLR
jgi:hypothetical protein